jgi:hypothetical protein
MCECGTYCGSDCCAFAAAVAITIFSSITIADAGAYVDAHNDSFGVPCGY